MQPPVPEPVLQLTPCPNSKGEPDGPPDQWKFLVIEDIGEVSQALELESIWYRRMSHFETMTYNGQQEYAG